MTTHYNRALARIELKQYTAAIADYDKALTLSLSKADASGAYHNRALRKYLMGLDEAARQHEAEADLQKAKQLDPDIEKKQVEKGR